MYKFNSLYSQVANELKQEAFGYFRIVRGDGNCYYRAVVYQYIELLSLSRNVEALKDLAINIYD